MFSLFWTLAPGLKVHEEYSESSNQHFTFEPWYLTPIDHGTTVRTAFVHVMWQACSNYHILSVLDTLHIVLISHGTYTLLITNFGVLTDISSTLWSLTLSGIVIVGRISILNASALYQRGSKFSLFRHRFSVYVSLICASASFAMSSCSLLTWNFQKVLYPSGMDRCVQWISSLDATRNLLL